jgi:hypothetical protein
MASSGLESFVKNCSTCVILQMSEELSSETSGPEISIFVETIDCHETLKRILPSGV